MDDCPTVYRQADAEDLAARRPWRSASRTLTNDLRSLRIADGTTIPLAHSLTPQVDR
jgi:hypothetical protein